MTNKSKQRQTKLPTFKKTTAQEFFKDLDSPRTDPKKPTAPLTMSQKSCSYDDSVPNDYKSNSTVKDTYLDTATFSWIKKPQVSLPLEVKEGTNNAESESDDGECKLSSPVRPEAVFGIQRFNYQEAKFY